jgi:N-acyl-L-homoserine lactone synthetase
MVTLTEINDPYLLNQYHRFRAKIYRESPVAGYLNNPDFDRDIYDDHALHFGWYEEGRLMGCIRFILPTASNQLYCYNILPKQAIGTAIKFVKINLSIGKRVIELSRICVAPESRSRKNVMAFSLAIIQKLTEMDIQEAIFVAQENHLKHWQLYGCEVLKGTLPWCCTKINALNFCMVYRHSGLPENIVRLLRKSNSNRPAA